MVICIAASVETAVGYSRCRRALAWTWAATAPDSVYPRTGWITGECSIAE